MGGQSPYGDDVMVAWLRGLLAIAWADGNFDEQERTLIAELTHGELGTHPEVGGMEPIRPDQLAAGLGADPALAENFLRTAVMVAIADGIYSSAEDEVLHQFCLALSLPTQRLEALRLTLDHPAAEEGVALADSDLHPSLLRPVQDWLDHLDIHDPRLAHFLCRLIPPQCPFERDVVLFGHKIVHIPPMCKINPLYEQLVGLRFRALSFLADDCQEDISNYC